MPTIFNCSMCSAPLDMATANGMTIRCPYCGNTSILPEELRSGVASGAASEPIAEGFVPMIDHALKLAEVAKLAKTGNKIAAIKLYRETFGGKLEDAKNAVEQMESGQPIVFNQTFRGTNASAQTFPQSFQPAQFVSPQAIKRTKRGAGIAVLIVILIPLTAAIFGIVRAFRAVSNINVPTSPTTSGGTSSSTPGFATNALEFGSEGIGAGQFKDARSVAIDGQERIYVGDYLDGRIQVFDSQGKFITQWTVDPKKPVRNLAADRKGIVYVAQGGTILRYDGATGNLLGEVAKPSSNPHEFYGDAFVALDGSLYTVSSDSNIIHIGADGQVKSVIKVAEKMGGDVHFDKLAVDGTGNIYAIENREESIYKFAPDGRYINKFGGKGREAGQLSNPQNIAVDGQGRVFVADAGRGIEVFDSNGRYINSFGSNVVFGIAINDRNEIFATERNRNKIVKYVLSK